ncbi:hypothetical protein PoHVEF18_006725 [Penicillium ochrochloron]
MGDPFSIFPPLVGFSHVSSRIGMLEVPALAKLTRKLYTQCNLIAKDTPDGFQELLPELGLLQENLRTLGDNMNSNTSFVKGINDDRRAALNQCLGACFQTLHEFQVMLHQHKVLNMGDGKGVSQSAVWATWRSQIKHLRAQIMGHTYDLSLCLSSAENTELTRTGRVMTRRVEENVRTTFALDSQPDQKLDAATASLSLRVEHENTGELNAFRLTQLQKIDQLKENLVHDRLKRVSTSSDPTLAISEGSLYGRAAPTSPPSLKRAHSLSQSTRDIISHEQCPIEQPLYDGSGGSRAVDQVFGDDNSDAQELHSVNQSEGLSSAAFDRSNFMQTLTSTMHELHQVRPQEPSVRPIRFHYQGFVNAGIGGKKSRIRTKGAPYMLLLATRDGESEPKIILCNQSAERNPRCIEFFMPLSKVQINREDESREILLKWSDACQERSDKTDGNYNTLHSYVYDGNAPNIGVGLHFRTKKGTEDFDKAVHELNFPSDFSWSQPSYSGRIYDVVDTGAEHKQYKAIVLFQERSYWRYSDVYYLYRDTDFTYDHRSLDIRFPQISFTDYTSTHVDQLYRADAAVGFSHCEKKLGSTVIEFNNDSASRSFISALSSLYDLVYARRIPSLSTKSIFPFGRLGKSGKGAADLQLWRRGNRYQLAARWDGSVSGRW